MAQTYSVELAGIDSVPAIKPSATAAYGARLKRFRATVNLASQAAADTIVLADLPAGYIFAFGLMTTSVSLSTATVAIGNATTAGKYRAAAVLTATDTPTPFGVATTLDDPALTATERIIATVGTAALPASGTLVVDIFASLAN